MSNINISVRKIMMLDMIDTHYKYTTSDLCISFENFCIEIHLFKKKKKKCSGVLSYRVALYPVILVTITLYVVF